MRLVPLALALAVSLPLTSSAEGPFTGSRLFVNHHMKHDVGRTFGVGLNFTIAPVRAAQKKLVEEFSQQPGADIVIKAAQLIDPADVEGLSAAELKARLKAVEGLSDADRASIDVAFENVSDNDIQFAADLLAIMQSEDTAIAFSLEPFLELHFDVLDLYFYVPLAGFAASDETDFALGNLGLDVRFGHTFGDAMAGGVSYGVQLWTPSGSGKAGGLGLANLLWSPKYFHQYLTAGPYVVVGGDFTFVQLQAHAAYNMMFGVRDEPLRENVHFLHWGASVAITGLPFVTISAELSGLVNVLNAPAYDSLYLTSGVRFVASFFDIGVAAQVPLVQAESSSFGDVAGVSFGSPSDYNVLLTAAFGF